MQPANSSTAARRLQLSRRSCGTVIRASRSGCTGMLFRNRSAMQLEAWPPGWRISGEVLALNCYLGLELPIRQRKRAVFIGFW